MERHELSAFEWVVLVVGTALGAVGGVVWAGAAATAALGGSTLEGSFTAALSAARRLPDHLSDPAGAWPPGAWSLAPPPALYWAATATVALAVAALLAVVARLLLRTRVGTVPRKPLGVDARARFATAADLRPLVVRGEQPGRFLL